MFHQFFPAPSPESAHDPRNTNSPAVSSLLKFCAIRFSRKRDLRFRKMRPKAFIGNAFGSLMIVEAYYRTDRSIPGGRRDPRGGLRLRSPNLRACGRLAPVTRQGPRRKYRPFPAPNDRRADRVSRRIEIHARKGNLRRETEREKSKAENPRLSFGFQTETRPSKRPVYHITEPLKPLKMRSFQRPTLTGTTRTSPSLKPQNPTVQKARNRHAKRRKTGDLKPPRKGFFFRFVPQAWLAIGSFLRLRS